MLGALAVGGYYGLRLLPLLRTHDASAAKVVLLHGLGRSEAAMLLLESALTAAGFDVHSIGYPSNDEPPEGLVDRVARDIERCCGDRPETVHFVGHSLGALLIRAYLAQHRPTNLGRVVLLGPPNKGSELADAERYELFSQTLLDRAGLNRWLPLPNDGMVSVESTRLEGMTDFIEFDVSHWELRNDRAVAAQVVEFLRNGRFSPTSARPG